jgi:hypothetical protein
MGTVSAKFTGLTREQLEHIDALAHRLLAQSAAKRVIVRLDGGAVIAKVGDEHPDQPLESHSEKLTGRLTVEVGYDDSTSLGLVRLRVRRFAEEIQQIVT